MKALETIIIIDNTLAPEAREEAEARLRYVASSAEYLLAQALQFGVVVTIECVPQQPPAMRGYDLRATLREAR